MSLVSTYASVSNIMHHHCRWNDNSSQNIRLFISDRLTPSLHGVCRPSDDVVKRDPFGY